MNREIEIEERYQENITSQDKYILSHVYHHKYVVICLDSSTGDVSVVDEVAPIHREYVSKTKKFLWLFNVSHDRVLETDKELEIRAKDVFNKFILSNSSH